MSPPEAAAREPWWKTGVIYQVYPRSFQDTDGDGVGDLAGIERRLPYLADLGVDAVWISPVFPSPMAAGPPARTSGATGTSGAIPGPTARRPTTG